MSGTCKVIILGHVGKQPETSYTQSGMAVCSFSMATSKKKKSGEEVTSWHRLKAFGKTAETIDKYVTAGQQLYIEGELNYGKYTHRDGYEVYATDIIVNQFVFVGKDQDRQRENKLPPDSDDDD